MSKHTFTPGPWDWRGMGRVRSNDGTHIADIWNTENGCMTEVEQANARLISQAPAMLEALEEMTAIVQHNANHSGYEEDSPLGRHIRAARAAIKAAKGEA